MAWLVNKRLKIAMQKDKKNLNNRYGDETPSLHDFLMVIVIMAVLIGLAWIIYRKFGWLH